MFDWYHEWLHLTNPTNLELPPETYPSPPIALAYNAQVTAWYQQATSWTESVQNTMYNCIVDFICLIIPEGDKHTYHRFCINQLIMPFFKIYCTYYWCNNFLIINLHWRIIKVGMYICSFLFCRYALRLPIEWNRWAYGLLEWQDFSKQ